MNPMHETPSALSLAGRNGRLPRGIHFAPPSPTLVPQAAANAAGMIQNPAYRSNNINDYVVFDTLSFTANQAQYQFFTQGVGANGKTRFDTNMVTGSQFPLGRNVVVKGIGFHLVFNSVATTLAQQVQALYYILENSFVDVVIQGRQFEFQAPGSMWLPEVAMSSLYTAASTSADVTAASQRIGDYIKHGGFNLSIPITLQNLVPFELDWNVNVQDSGVADALTVLAPNEQRAAKMRWHLKATLEQGT